MQRSSVGAKGGPPISPFEVQELAGMPRQPAFLYPWGGGLSAAAWAPATAAPGHVEVPLQQGPVNSMWSGSPSPGAWVPPSVAAGALAHQAVPPATEWRPIIEDMYRRFNPAKLPELDGILAKYSGNAAELYRALCEKYAPCFAQWPGEAPYIGPPPAWPQVAGGAAPRAASASDSESAYSVSTSEDEEEDEEAKLGLSR